MQKITKTCEICKKQEVIKKTMQNPKPESTFREVKIPGLGKTVPGLNMDLCPDHHRELISMVQRWVTKTKPLDSFSNDLKKQG